MIALRLAASLLPIVMFLITLVFLDSFKLVKMHHLFALILIGGLSAVTAFPINTFVFHRFATHAYYYSRIGAPLLEEVLKGACIVWLLAYGYVAFMVDAAIFGFAIGAGFVLIENTYYAGALGGDASSTVWLLRGFGLAIMHGGTTAMLGLIGSTAVNDRASRKAARIAQGLVVAWAIHAFYNTSFFGPTASAVLVIAGLPVVFALAFVRSEHVLRSWLTEGMDADIELISAITKDELAETNAGKYLASLRQRFSPELVADMFCLLSLSAELSMRAKGELMAREMGLKPAPDPELQEKLAEINSLQKNIGTTGKLALSPLRGQDSREFWQFHFLKN
jgi:RsiW-degrading membrane proteinase PrsW (M82 family)